MYSSDSEHVHGVQIDDHNVVLHLTLNQHLVEHKLEQTHQNLGQELRFLDIRVVDVETSYVYHDDRSVTMIPTA